MTTTINASNSGSGGLVQTADASGILALQTAGTTAVSISAAQVVTLTNALPVASGGTGSTTNAGTSFALKGANSDITSLTGLTTALSVGQGGTSLTTLTANNVILGNGTSAPAFVAPSTSGNVLTSNGTTWTSAAGGGFGVGQTLTNFSSSGRAMGTTYTNSTGKPIAVMFNPGASGNLFCSALIDGNVVEFQQFTPSGGGGCAAFFIMVPNGSTYQMRNDGNAGLSNWYEWR